MEKQGIITGIGNEITPEIDAVINDFIVGGNAIIKGLDWVDNTLNAGMCQLRGYRGVLEQTITTTDKYVYGKFIINFDKDIEDEFYIITTNEAPIDGIINPISITSAGTYYLLLYTNRATTLPIYTTTLPKYKYPKQANTSDRARDLIAGGTIGGTATTETASVNTHNTQPNRVANTEYVHKQIEEELKELKLSGNLLLKSDNKTVVGIYELTRRARLVTIELNYTKTTVAIMKKFVPDDCLPTSPIYFYGAGTTGSGAVFKMDVNGEISLYATANVGASVPSMIGYEI